MFLQSLTELLCAGVTRVCIIVRRAQNTANSATTACWVLFAVFIFASFCFRVRPPLPVGWYLHWQAQLSYVFACCWLFLPVFHSIGCAGHFLGFVLLVNCLAAFIVGFGIDDLVRATNRRTGACLSAGLCLTLCVHDQSPSGFTVWAAPSLIFPWCSP